MPVFQNAPAGTDDFGRLISADFAKRLLKPPGAHHPLCCLTDLGQDPICSHHKGTFTNTQRNRRDLKRPVMNAVTKCQTPPSMTRDNAIGCNFKQVNGGSGEFQ